jgi:hypothetical protein
MAELRLPLDIEHGLDDLNEVSLAQARADDICRARKQPSRYPR